MANEWMRKTPIEEKILVAPNSPTHEMPIIFCQLDTPLIVSLYQNIITFI